MSGALNVGLLLYPGVTHLDLTGPHQVFAATPGLRTHTVWKTIEPIVADSGLTLMPSTTFADCPQLDAICLPGGLGQAAIQRDPAVLDFVRRQGDGARYVTSVCTGALILGQAGLLKGYRAATHWAFMHLLAGFGAIAVSERVVRDRNRLTGGGVTAGIDVALTCVAELMGERVAKSVQLGLEYRPAPPFASGHPDEADPELVAEIRRAWAPLIESVAAV